MTETSHSQRRACALVGMDPKTYRYESRRPDDAGIRKRLRELAEQRRRFGYRRLHILPAREGIRLNHKSSIAAIARNGSRCASEAGASGRSARVPRCCSPGTATSAGRLDFVADALADGRRFRILAVVDDFSRECLALVVDTSLSWRPRGSGAGPHRRAAGPPPHAGQRQRRRAHLKRYPALAAGTRRWLALHRTGQAHAKRLCRELQRPPARRVPQRTSLRRPGPKRGGSSRNGGTTTTQHAPHTSLDGPTPNEFAARPNWGHNLKRFYL